MIATVEVAGPFKVERKPLTITIEASTYAATAKKYVQAQSWMPVSGIVFVLVIVLVIVAVLAARKKTLQLKSKTQEGEIRDRLKAG